jgi:hypothetical protein
LTDLHALVDRQSQTDPQFRTHRLSTRLTAAAVRRQSMTHTGYTDAELPTAEPIGTELTLLGSYPQQVAKSRPQKKSRQRRPSSPR